jgi:hypothetical protein
MTNERPTRTRKYKTKYKPERKAYIVRLPAELALIVDTYAGVFTSDDYKQKIQKATVNDVLTAIIFDYFFDYDVSDNTLKHYDALWGISSTLEVVDDIDNIIWDFNHTPLTDAEINRYVEREVVRELRALERSERITQSVNKIVTKRDAWGAGDDEKLKASIQEARERIAKMLEAKRQQQGNK